MEIFYFVAALLVLLNSFDCDKIFEANSNNPNIHGEHAGDNLDQGDIMFRKGEENATFGVEGSLLNNSKREIIRSSLRRWDLPIPYTIEPGMHEVTINAIKVAMAELTEKTCIRFRKAKSTDQHVIKFKNDFGCWSYLGKAPYRTQEISLNYRGCSYSNTAVHEIMHTLGFYHEQSRSDRDKYVKINWENIKKGKEGQFKKIKTKLLVTNLKHAYDYRSVMHYPSDAFAKPGKKSIYVPGKPNMKLGNWYTNAYSLSPTDVSQIKDLYCGEKKKTEAGCTFVRGYGYNLDYLYHGYTNDRSICIKQCHYEMKETETITGVTYDLRNKKCYCAKGRVIANGYSSFISCQFNVPEQTEAACKFVRGVGASKARENLGIKVNPTECLATCVARSKSNAAINGITVRVKDNTNTECYCEISMPDKPTAAVGQTFYYTCAFTKFNVPKDETCEFKSGSIKATKRVYMGVTTSPVACIKSCRSNSSFIGVEIPSYSTVICYCVIGEKIRIAKKYRQSCFLN